MPWPRRAFQGSIPEYSYMSGRYIQVSISNVVVNQWTTSRECSHISECLRKWEYWAVGECARKWGYILRRCGVGVRWGLKSEEMDGHLYQSSYRHLGVKYGLKRKPEFTKNLSKSPIWGHWGIKEVVKRVERKGWSELNWTRRESRSAPDSFTLTAKISTQNHIASIPSTWILYLNVSVSLNIISLRE
jgi:hypothetical protein